MPVRLIRSDSNAALWEAFSGSFLGAIRDQPGPGGHPDYAWLTHRTQRDLLLETAAERGARGWFAPPIAFFSELRRMFGIESRPVGILTGRMLVARLASRHAGPLAFDAVSRSSPGGTHMLDSVFSELLPEGVSPEALREALGTIEGDEFTERRNAWVSETYAAFLRELEKRGLYDPRSIHAIVADRIDEGGLPAALGGASTLHVYGLTSLRTRRRLMESLARQEAVDVVVYLTMESDGSEWAELEAAGEEFVSANGPARRSRPRVEVQPAPDSVREAAWVARRVKRLLADGEAAPHEVVVVARSGHRDTRLVHAALEAAGVPSTARLRTVLAEIPVLKALLGLLKASADGWRYEGLRQVLASPYFGIGVDLRAVDHLASLRRIEGLEAWREGLQRIRHELSGQDGWRLERQGLFARQLDEDLSRFEAFRETAEGLRGGRRERAWIDLTIGILAGAPFDVRTHLCDPVAGRHDLVRLDQRGVLQVESLLREWRGLVDDDVELTAAEWHGRLARLLSANDLALSTPMQEGVQVLEAHEAALTPFRFAFVVHANDGEFPRAGSGQGVLGDDERSRLRAAGIPLSCREEALRREHALWRAVTRMESVVISYRTTDASGTPRLPSLLVPDHDPRLELPRTLDLATVGDGRNGELAPVSPAQHRRREVQRLAVTRRGGSPDPFVTPDTESIRHAVLGAFADALRDGDLDPFVRRESDLGVPTGASRSEGVAEDPSRLFGRDLPVSQRPSAWNGKLRDPVVLARLGEKFDADYLWSASQLETYGKRPFDFLLQRVLYLEQMDEAEEETTPLASGTVAHAILEEFYRSVMSDLPSELDERTLNVFERAADRAIAEAENDADRWLGLPPVWAVRKGAVRDEVRSFVAYDLAALAKAGEAPRYLEFQFGGSGEPEVVIRGLDLRGQEASLRLRGRIDRIEQVGKDSGGALRIMDYKSGTSSMPRRTGYLDGALLQTALYMKAVETLGLGCVDLGRYRSIRDRKNVYPLKYADIEPTLRLALSIPGRVREGLFEAVQAASSPIKDWQPQRDVTRTEALLEGGSRFDPVSDQP